MYTVTVAGTFFATALEVGDVLIAEIDSAAVEADWTVVQKNMNAASIKSSYESNADTNEFSDAEQSKLASIEASATADQTGAEIKTAYEAEANTNAFTDAEQSKLASIEASATADQSAAEIKTAYESNADTNEFSDAEQSKLAGIAAGAIANLSEDASPSLGGDLSLGANVVIHDANGMKRGSSASNFLEEEYIHAVSLLASQTNTVASDFTFAHASFEGCIIEYKMKEATSNDVRVGKILVATDGTNVSITDSFAETADTGITWSAAVNVGDVEIKYSSGANACTMRADVKRIKA
jgi:hypothetical protein